MPSPAMSSRAPRSVTTMPDWQPNWIDVDFDHAAATAAATACDDAADRLSTSRTELSSLASGAVVGWRGNARSNFDSGVDRIDDESFRVMSSLRAQADAIRSGATRARVEQQDREDDRDRWRRERDEEIRVAAEAAEDAREAADTEPPTGGVPR